MSDASEESDADEPEYVGSIQPYMFEPTVTAEEAAARRAVKRKTDSETDGRHAADIQTWYVIRVLVKCRSAEVVGVNCGILLSWYWRP